MQRSARAILASVCMASVPAASNADLVGIEATKLIVVDKLATAGKAKTIFVSKDPAVAIPQNALNFLTPVFKVSYAGSDGPAASQFTVPHPPFGLWTVRTTQVAKFVNRDAPGGPTQAKVALMKSGKLLKLVGKGLGDDPLDLLGAGAPVGSVQTAYVVGDGGLFGNTYCSEFSGCLFKEIAGGTGRKLVCKGGLPDATCGAIGAHSVCCEGFPPFTTCMAAFSVQQCILIQGTPASDDAVCSGNGGVGECGAAPGIPGDCCETNFGLCGAFSQELCTGFLEGTFVPNTVCQPSGSCQ